MNVVPFNDSGKCHGSTSNITQALRPICLTCPRLTSKRNPAQIKGKVFLISGTADCQWWKPHVWNVRLLTEADKSAVYGGGGSSINTAAGLGA